MDYVIRACSIQDVKRLCEQYHAYNGAGDLATYSFGVFEGSRIVAAYSWNPPPPQAAKSVCKNAPHGVLALSRMVAVPRSERLLNHVSRPLRHQMKHLVDRTRWPVLITFSDEGEGHTGHVYKCSGWKSTTRKRHPFYTDANGKRTSSYRGGKRCIKGLTKGGYTWLQRWEHWATQDPATWIADNGWRRVPVPGKKWKSGAQAFTWKREVESAQQDMFG